MVLVSNSEILRGKRIAFVTAGYTGKRFIYEKANKLGVLSVVIDSSDSWAQSMVEEGVIEAFISVDFTQDTSRVISEIVQQLNTLHMRLDGVCTFAELSLPVAARLARKLGLPGEDPEIVSLVRDKHRVRQYLGAHGGHQTRSYAIKSSDDLITASECVGFPAVLKPISGADSLGVKRVNSYEELVTAFGQMQEVVSGLIVSSGALSRGLPKESSVNHLGNGGSPKLVAELASKYIPLDLSLEEYLDGPEVDVDIVMFRGKRYFAAVVDNGPTIEPYFAETWNLCPSLLTVSQQEQLVNEAMSTLHTLGFENGVFHVEQKFTSRDGPRIVEVNARMGGGPIRLQHKFVFGIDLVEQQLLICLGLPPSYSSSTVLPVPVSPNRSFVSATPNALVSGTITDTSFLDRWIKCRSDVVDYWEFLKPGEYVIGPDDGLPSWICEFALAGSEGSQKLLDTMLSLTFEMTKDVADNFCKKHEVETRFMPDDCL